jgi:hypothetical protein
VPSQVFSAVSKPLSSTEINAYVKEELKDMSKIMVFKVIDRCHLEKLVSLAISVHVFSVSLNKNTVVPKRLLTMHC